LESGSNLKGGVMTTESQAVPIDPDAVGVMPDGVTHYLLGGKCGLCGKLFFPKREVCPVCFDQSKIEGIALNPQGTIVSYTVVRKAPGRRVPFALGYVQTLDGLMVFAPLGARDMDQLRVGMEVQCVFSERENPDGEPWVIYEFVPVQKADGDSKGEAK
jgi:uncharacterized protein